MGRFSARGWVFCSLRKAYAASGSSATRPATPEVIHFDALVRYGMIAREDLDLFQYADDPASALAILQARLGVDGGDAQPGFAHSRARKAPGG